MIKKIFDLFRDFEIYLVGGYVRDCLLGIESHDIDFATSAKPEETNAILDAAGFKTHTVGWAFGTVGIIENGYEIHITTYRRNEDYQRDNRHPVVEWGTTIQEDLTRRDFTINALAQDRKGKILNLFDGLEHLKDKILQTPIDAETAFSDDPLRILRAVRFRAKLNFEYSENVKKALKFQAHRLLILPKERILEELNKILVTDKVDLALKDLMNCKLFNYFIPELTVLQNIEQCGEYHHKNVWLHTIDVVKNIPVNIVLRWAALFHDLGKPYTLSTDEGIHFYRHELISALMVKSILLRLGLPKRWNDSIIFMVKNHMRPNIYDSSWSDSAIRRFIRDMGVQLDNVLTLSTADITSHNQITVQKHLVLLNELKTRIKTLSAFKEIKSPLDGYEIMAEFNLTPSKRVGEMQKLLIDALIEGRLQPNEDRQIYVDYLRGMV